VSHLFEHIYKLYTFYCISHSSQLELFWCHLYRNPKSSRLSHIFLMFLPVFNSLTNSPVLLSCLPAHAVERCLFRGPELCESSGLCVMQRGKRWCHDCMLYTERRHECWHAWGVLQRERDDLACDCMRACAFFCVWNPAFSLTLSSSEYLLDTPFNSCHFNSHSAISLEMCRRTRARSELLTQVLKSDRRPEEAVWRSNGTVQFIAVIKGTSSSLKHLYHHSRPHKKKAKCKSDADKQHITAAVFKLNVSVSKRVQIASNQGTFSVLRLTAVLKCWWNV